MVALGASDRALAVVELERHNQLRVAVISERHYVDERGPAQA